MIVDLFYLSPNPYGGWVTFTAHLVHALKAVGCQTRLFKITSKGERNQRDFGYGIKYQNIRIDQVSRSYPKLIVAAAKNFKSYTQTLLEKGTWLVLHDPTELKNVNPPENRTIVIRRVGLTYVPKAFFIPHPYKRQDAIVFPKRTIAVSTSRIDFDKHTEILLEANRLLEDHQKIHIYGFENRLYTKFKILPKYPEWVQSKVAYKRTMDKAVNLLKDALFMVDMSEIKGDGGGTQYTTLEAWDAGAIPVINRKWLLQDGVMNDMQPGKNCLVVDGPEDLVEIIKEVNVDKPFTKELRAIQNQGYKELENHEHGRIGGMYLEAMQLI